MIITDFVVVKITKRNIDHFKSFYKNIKLKDIIKVNPNELQKNSNLKLDVSCDICGIERKIKYQAYTKNLNSSIEYPIYTCDKCSHIKIKSHNLNRYGVEYYSQTDDYNIKFRETMQKRYGVDYSMQSDYIKQKSKNTNLERYGVENIFQDNEFIREKFKDKWGVDHPSKVDEIIKKTKVTKELNGTSLSSIKIRKKIKRTNNLKYGSNTPMESDILRNNIISNDPSYLRYIGNGISEFICLKKHLFYIDSSNYHNRRRSNLSLCTVCNPIGDSQSIKEKEIYEFIKSIYPGEIIQSYRDGLEIDIYLPDLKIGFEFNGLYWHSEKYKDKNYHLNKLNYFKGKEIRIINIWEDDWIFKKDIIKSQISNLLGYSKKLYARSCQVKEIKDSKISSKFLNDNHIQGSDKSVIKLGLFYKSNLVSIMTFNTSEGRKKMSNNEWNLSRFCNKIGLVVVGGASKLLSFFKRNFSPKRVISYADKDWSLGDLYFNLCFSLVYETKPDYKYIVENQRVHKSRYRKSRLNTDLTESQEMKKSQTFRIWDCGKIKFELLA